MFRKGTWRGRTAKPRNPPQLSLVHRSLAPFTAIFFFHRDIPRLTVTPFRAPQLRPLCRSPELSTATSRLLPQLPSLRRNVPRLTAPSICSPHLGLFHRNFPFSTATLPVLPLLGIVHRNCSLSTATGDFLPQFRKIGRDSRIFTPTQNQSPRLKAILPGIAIAPVGCFAGAVRETKLTENPQLSRVPSFEATREQVSCSWRRRAICRWSAERVERDSRRHPGLPQH